MKLPSTTFLPRVRSSRHKKHHTHLSHQILLSRPTTSHLGNSITNVASVSTLRPAHLYIITDDKARKDMKLLKEAGMRKFDIASGEPFLHPKFLSSLIRYCKENLGVDASVSSVTVARSPRSGCRRTPSGWISWLSPVILLMLGQTSKLGAVKTKKNADQLCQIAE